MKKILVSSFFLFLSARSFGAPQCLDVYSASMVETTEFEVAVKKIFNSPKIRFLNWAPGLKYRDAQVDKLTQEQLSNYFSENEIEAFNQSRIKLSKISKASQSEVLSDWKNKIHSAFNGIHIHLKALQDIHFNEVNSYQDLYDKLYNLSKLTSSVIISKRDVLALTYVMKDSDLFIEALNVNFIVDSMINEVLNTPFAKQNKMTESDVKRLFSFFGNAVLVTSKNINEIRIETSKMIMWVQGNNFVGLSPIRYDSSYDYLNFAKNWLLYNATSYNSNGNLIYQESPFTLLHQLLRPESKAEDYKELLKLLFKNTKW